MLRFLDIPYDEDVFEEVVGASDCMAQPQSCRAGLNGKSLEMLPQVGIDVEEALKSIDDALTELGYRCEKLSDGSWKLDVLPHSDFESHLFDYSFLG